MNESRIEAERLFISSALFDNGVLAETLLDASMFTKYAKLYQRILDLAPKATVNVEALIVHGADLDPALIASLDPFTSTSWMHYQKAIFDAWAQDKIHAACKVALTSDFPSAVEALDRTLSAVQLRETGSRTKSLGELLLPALERIKQRMELRGRLPGYSFGLSTVDWSTLGAQEGQVVVIGARPSQGKSALMAQFARHMAKTVKVGIFTVESSDSELVGRIFTAESQVDGRLISSGKLSPGDMARVVDAGHRLHTLRDNLIVHDQPGLTLSQLFSVARRMAREGVKVIFLDYLQLVRVPGKESRREEVAEVSTALKALARELKVCVIALAQLSRDSDEKRPGMGDCQHSSQIEQDADQVWLIWHRRDREGRVIDSRIILDKVRDGMTRDVLVRFERSTLTFCEIEKEAS